MNNEKLHHKKMIKKRKEIKKVVKKKPIKKKIVKKVVKEKKKLKINPKKVLIFLLFIYLLISLVISILNFKIKNIVIENNKIMTDQEIIEIAKISKYPSFFKTMSSTIEKRLLKNEFIMSAKVSKNLSGELTIKVTENHPLFYNSSNSRTILADGRETNKNVAAPILINYVPDNVYPVFIKKMQGLNKDVLNRTSEIQYTPNEVDDSRFLFYMIDGNYVYLTLSKFNSINDYVNIMENIIAKFGNKNGILNLDAGGYFDLLE